MCIEVKDLKSFNWVKISIIILFLLLFSLGCCNKDGGKKPEVKVTEPEQPPSLGGGTAGNACYDAGFFPCVADACTNETRNLPAGNDKVCCSEPCQGTQEITTLEGDSNKTCAAQNANNCGETKTCPDQQWMKSNDVSRCCKVTCIDRVQTMTTIAGLGEIIIERVGQGKFGVFYGPGAKVGGIDVGKSAYANAVSVGGNEYEFTITDGRKFRFKISKETESSISAVDSTPPSLKNETMASGCQILQEGKGDGNANFDIIPVPSQCKGKQCQLRLKNENNEVFAQTLFIIRDDNSWMTSGTSPALPIPNQGQIPGMSPASNGKNDGKSQEIIFGGGECTLFDDYYIADMQPGRDKTKIVLSTIMRSGKCKLEVCTT